MLVSVSRPLRRDRPFARPSRKARLPPTARPEIAWVKLTHRWVCNSPVPIRVIPGGCNKHFGRGRQQAAFRCPVRPRISQTSSSRPGSSQGKAACPQRRKSIRPMRGRRAGTAGATVSLKLLILPSRSRSARRGNPRAAGAEFARLPWRRTFLGEMPSTGNSSSATL